MRFNVNVSVEEEDLSRFICDLLTRRCVPDTEKIEHMVKNKEYMSVLDEIERHRKKLFNLDSTLEDVSKIVQGYIELKNPPSLPTEQVGTKQEDQE